MSKTTALLNQDGYLLVKVNSPWSVESAKQVIDEAKTEATKQGYKRILFDLTKWSSPASEMTRFYSGVELAEKLPYPFKVAAFALPKNINKFGENAAVNRFAWFQIFTNELSAVKWLMEGDSNAAEDTNGA